jgi:hypothetical protein
MVELEAETRKASVRTDLLKVVGGFVLVVVTMIIADFAGLPATKILNLVLNGGEEGKRPFVVFSRRNGYQFPIISTLIDSQAHADKVRKSVGDF